jgi:hypothetical protein
VRGETAYDEVRILPAEAVYRRVGPLVLGDGERIVDDRYLFQAPFRSRSRNHARPLVAALCRFNTNRWVFGKGDRVAYRHAVGRRTHESASVEVAVTWHVRGALIVSASTPWAGPRRNVSSCLHRSFRHARCGSAWKPPRDGARNRPPCRSARTPSSRSSRAPRSAAVERLTSWPSRKGIPGEPSM